MTKRTRPDANQTDIEEMINLAPGCRFIDTHDVPFNLPELTGFPDGLIVNEYALTIVCEDPEQVLALLNRLPGVRTIRGGILPVEVKTEKGALRESQENWGQKYGVEQIVLKSRRDVSELLDIKIEGDW